MAFKARLLRSEDDGRGGVADKRAKKDDRHGGLRGTKH